MGRKEKELLDKAGGTKTITEGKAVITFKADQGIFYNPIQQVNRDLSILAIQAFLKEDLQPKWRQKTKPSKIEILEAMSASGIRAIRYALEITGIDSIVANDNSSRACASIAENCTRNNVMDKVSLSQKDCLDLMYSERNKFFAVDLDPYGSPAGFLDAAVQSVVDGGMLLVTATDMAVLAGNAAETCYAKYGSMSLKSKACHEMALRIMIHAVQASANRYGRFVQPLLSLKIDFYIRLFFRVEKSPVKCKETARKTSVVYQCSGCFTLNFQAMGIRKENGVYGFSQGPTVPQLCEFCDSKQHVGGPIWTGEIHDAPFVKEMLAAVNSSHDYLGTKDRIMGLLNVVLEEVPNAPLLYDLSQLCSVIKCSTTPMLQMRSAVLNLGYEVSLSHVAPNTMKTNAPNRVIWDILLEWHKQCANVRQMKPETAGFKILAKTISTKNISFEIRDDANPESREKGFVRYQVNPTRNWGPGVRDTPFLDFSKRTFNQGKKERRALKSKQAVTALCHDEQSSGLSREHGRQTSARTSSSCVPSTGSSSVQLNGGAMNSQNSPGLEHAIKTPHEDSTDSSPPKSRKVETDVELESEDLPDTHSRP